MFHLVQFCVCFACIVIPGGAIPEFQRDIGSDIKVMETKAEDGLADLYDWLIEPAKEGIQSGAECPIKWTLANNVDPDQTPQNAGLIRVYNVCGENYIPYKLVNNRRKRSILSLLTGAFWKGLKAQSALLQGARVVPPLKKTDTLGTEYVKAGGYRQAIKDFESVNPANRNDFRYPGKVRGMFGNVGDRTIMLENHIESGTSVMKIIRRDGRGKEHTVRIRYPEKNAGKLSKKDAN